MFRCLKRDNCVDISDGNTVSRRNLYYYNSEHEAATAWSHIYRSRGIRREYAAFIYTAEVRGVKQYFTGKTHAGMEKHGIIRANVVIPFLFMYLIQSITERLKRNAKAAAFIHTHPAPPPGYTCRNHSSEDLFLLKLPGIQAVYVIPYENKEINRAVKQRAKKKK